MKKEELKKLLKPLIRECIIDLIKNDSEVALTLLKESIGAIGDLSNAHTAITESKAISAEREKIFDIKRESKLKESEKRKIQESKERLLEAIGREAYNGNNPFEGTDPLPTAEQESRAITSDPGVPVDKAFAHIDFKKKLDAINKFSKRGRNG